MKRLFFLLVLICAAGLRAADALPLFYATLTLGTDQRFVLVDPAGKASGYLRIGDAFAGYAIKAYDVNDSVLDVERDGRVFRLSLAADARIKSAANAERHALERMLEKLAPGGKVVVGGKRLVSFGGKNVAVGSKFAVQHEDKEYERELVDLQPNGLTVRWRGAEITRPFRPVGAKN